MAPSQPSLIRRGARRALAASGITAAILYSWWQAVENARTPQSLPQAEVGEPLVLGRVALTPSSLQLRAPSPSSSDQRPLLVLSAKLENITGQTQANPIGPPQSLIEAKAGKADLGVPDVKLLRDGEFLKQLQPRMPEEVEIIWHAPQGWRAGEVAFTFFRQQFKLKDNLYGQASWLGYSAAAHMAATPEAAP
ncbi:hypothetical protein [Pusillimonas noertemannii]|uniref:hypothetical protein n=1 Tax=Pusillimonas noertemannii TaxID=305977 RepID=UPI0033420856